MRHVAATLFLLFTALAAWAQPVNTNCATAALLCAEQPLSGNNTGAAGLLPGFCGTSNVLWYTFTTNTVGGEVTVELQDIDCPVIVGMDNELSLVALSNANGCTPASFVVLSGDPCLSQDSTLFGVVIPNLLPSTQYWVIVAGVADDGATDFAQCDFQIAVSGPGANVVNVDFDAGPNVSIAEGESTQLNAVGGTTYSWSPTSGLSGASIPDPIASPLSSTIYSVTTTIGGCTYVDQVNVEVLRLIIPPNTFTPNGDGKNDTWVIPGIVDYPGAEVNIHDRWGQRVYSSTGYREPWDGTNNGKALTDGTYYYHIQLNQLEGRSAPYTGFISILR